MVIPKGGVKLFFTKKRRVKLLCSYGGEFQSLQALPHNNKLLYVGGVTSIIGVERNIKHNSLRSELERKLEIKSGSNFSVKFLLPGEELEFLNLLSLSDDSDFKQMMSLGASTKLRRLFVFPGPDEPSQSPSTPLSTPPPPPPPSSLEQTTENHPLKFNSAAPQAEAIRQRLQAEAYHNSVLGELARSHTIHDNTINLSRQVNSAPMTKYLTEPAELHRVHSGLAISATNHDDTTKAAELFPIQTASLSPSPALSPFPPQISPSPSVLSVMTQPPLSASSTFNLAGSEIEEIIDTGPGPTTDHESRARLTYQLESSSNHEPKASFSCSWGGKMKYVNVNCNIDYSSLIKELRSVYEADLNVVKYLCPYYETMVSIDNDKDVQNMMKIYRDSSEMMTLFLSKIIPPVKFSITINPLTVFFGGSTTLDNQTGVCIGIWHRLSRREQLPEILELPPNSAKKINMWKFMRREGHSGMPGRIEIKVEGNLEKSYRSYQFVCYRKIIFTMNEAKNLSIPSKKKLQINPVLR